MRYSYLIIFLLTHFFVAAQCGNRYLSDISTSVVKHADIQYGENYDSKNVLTPLLMDVYEPNNDTSTTIRPLMIFVHGGSFVSGDRQDQRIDLNAEYFARKGYVTANIEYRLEQNVFITPFLNYADRNNWYKAIIRAVHDIKATIRYFKKDVAENGNTYNIDTTQIILYGSSAGAIACLHTTFINSLEEASPSFQTNFEALGGLEGNSGNNNYTSSGIRAIVSCSGAMDNTDYLDNNTNVAYIGFHHTIDLVVPYDVGCFDVVFCHLGKFYGDKSIYDKSQSLTMNSEFYSFKKLGHPADTYDEVADRAFLLQKTTEFLYRNVICNETITPIKTTKTNELKIYPNPAGKQISINFPQELIGKQLSLRIYNLLSQEVYHQEITVPSTYSTLIDLPNGTYYVVAQDKQQKSIVSTKLVVQQ